MPRILDRLALGDGRKFLDVDVRHARANLLRGRAIDAPRQAVHSALRIDHHEVAPVAACKRPARLLQRRLKRRAGIGALPEPRDVVARVLGADARPLGLLLLLVARPALRPRLAVAFDMRALHPFMAEGTLEFARDDLMLAVIVAVADRPQRVEVDPRPYDVKMFPVFLLVHHHHARLAGESEFLFEPVYRLLALLRRHALIGARVDRGVIKRTLAVRATRRDGLHFASKRRAHPSPPRRAIRGRAFLRSCRCA